MKPKILSLVLAVAVLVPATIAAAGPEGGGSQPLVFADENGRVVRTVAPAHPYVVHLGSGTVDLRRYAVTKADFTGHRPRPLIVAFEGVPSAARQRALEATGARVIGPVPPSAWLVRADAAAARAIAELDGVAVTAKLATEWKLSRRLPLGPVPEELEVVLFDGAAAELVVVAIEDLGRVVSVTRVGDRLVVKAVLSVADVDKVAGLPEVEMVDVPAVGGFFNNEVRVVMQTERAHFTANQAFYNPIYGIGVWGAGQIITAADTGLNAHEVFAGPGKVLANYAVPNTCVTGTGDASNHGTGVVATLQGDKIGASGLYGTANDLDGLSLRSTLVMQDIDDTVNGFCPPADYVVDLFYPVWLGGSMVHTNSWGHWAVPNNPQGTYSFRSQRIDEYMNHPAFREHVIVFAAGNAGAIWPPGSGYVPYSLSDEGHSKNAIVVGGSGNGNARDWVYTYSSRGPTDDCLGVPCPGIQRVKPDVLAPADLWVDTADTAGFSAYSIFPGTSVAAPAVAGAAAMVRDYFAQGIYPVNASDPPLGGPPSSALVKAMLVNATVPIYDPTGYLGNAAQGLPANAYPNYDQGYGRPALDNVLEPAGYRKLKAFEDATTTVDTGDLWERTVNIKEKWGARCNTLRVTLAWNDPKGILAAGPKLVNDLDLEVTYKGVVWRGNHFLTGGAVFDSTNNVEDVFIAQGSTALGTIHKPVVRVYGTSVPSGPQPFAVVVTYGACADNIPCPPPPVAGGCYRGPGDVVPGSTWVPPVPGCDDQVYDTGEFDGSENPYPRCKPPTYQPADPEPTDEEPVGTVNP